jgi:hypothetical protein
MATDDRLLHRDSTSGVPPPQTRRRRRSGASTGRGRVREDLFRRDAAAIASSTPPENLDLETLGPKLPPTPPAGKRLTISATLRRPAGHGRRTRPPALPAATRTPFFASLNCSGRAFERRKEGCCAQPAIYMLTSTHRDLRNISLHSQID